MPDIQPTIPKISAFGSTHGSGIVQSPLVNKNNPAVMSSTPVTTVKSASVKSGSSPISFTYLDKFGAWGDGEGYFKYPTGVTLDSLGNIYVVDQNNNRVQKFNSNKKYLSKWGTYGSNYGSFWGPTAIAIDSGGYLYVVDSGNNRIQKFSTDGTFVLSFGSGGNGDGKFNHPEGIAIGKDNTIYVSDTRNNRIQKFSQTGQFLGKWGVYGSGNTGMNHPIGIAVDSSNTVYVGDEGNDRIVKYSSDGDFLSIWKVDNEFRHVTFMTFGPDNNLYILDIDIDRILVYSANGVKAGEIGSAGSGDGYFYNPCGLAFDSSGTYAYVSDTDNQRIQVFNTNLQSGPVISSISPNTGSAGVVPFTITGRNFVSGLTVSFTQTGCTKLPVTVKSVSSTSISGTVTIPAAPCSTQWNVVVRNPNGLSSGSLVFKIVNKPVVSAIYQPEGARNKLVPFLIMGSNFKGTGQTVSLTKSGAATITATNVTAINTKQMYGTFRIPAGAKTGSYLLRVKQGSYYNAEKVYFRVY